MGDLLGGCQRQLGCSPGSIDAQHGASLIGNPLVVALDRSGDASLFPVLDALDASALDRKPKARSQFRGSAKTTDELCVWMHSEIKHYV